MGCAKSSREVACRTDSREKTLKGEYKYKSF